MRGRIFLLVTIAAAVFAIKLLNPFGPTIMPIASIISKEIGKHLEVAFWKHPDEAIAAIKAEKADFYVLPLTLGVNLYESGFDLVLLGIHEWKVFYLVSQHDMKSLKDLKGKTVYSSHTRGTVVDVLLRMFLKKEGLRPDEDVKIVYAQPPEIVALFKAGKIEYAALPEPFVTMIVASGKGKVVLDFQKKWSEITGLPSRIPIAGLFTSRKFLQKHPLESEYVEMALWLSTALMNEDPAHAAKITSEVTKIPAKILELSTSRMVFDYIPIEKCRNEVEQFLKVLKEEYPQGLKGIPDEGFYR